MLPRPRLFGKTIILLSLVICNFNQHIFDSKIIFVSLNHSRSDLEAAARAKSKLSSSNNPSLAKEDAQTITSLHNQLVELEGISTYLPALTSRLTELANLHSNAAEFGSRLDAAEETLVRTEALLLSLEVALEKVEGGWKENMEAVERNVKRLDELVSGK